MAGRSPPVVLRQQWPAKRRRQRFGYSTVGSSSSTLLQGEDASLEFRYEDNDVDERLAERRPPIRRQQPPTSRIVDEPLSTEEAVAAASESAVVEECVVVSQPSPSLEAAASTAVANDQCSSGFSKPMPSSLPMLLMQREIWGRKGSLTSRRSGGGLSEKTLVHRMLYKCDSSKICNDGVAAMTTTARKAVPWRPYCTRILKFRELKTSSSDAILGIDATGSYFVALRGSSAEINQSAAAAATADMSLCLLALPSKSASSTSRPPALVLNIPLHGDDGCMGHDNVNGSTALAAATRRQLDEASLFAPPAPARVPVRIWLCGSLGVCLYRDTDTSMGTVLFFPTPRATSHPLQQLLQPQHSTLVAVNKLQGIRLGCQEVADATKSKGVNQLWRVPFVPSYHRTSMAGDDALLCETVEVGKPSYCFVVEETGGGYRLTWVVDNTGWNHSAPCQYQSAEPRWDANTIHEPPAIQCNGSIVRAEPLNIAGWETMISDRYTGEVHDFDTTTANGCGFVRPNFSIAFSAILNVANLLHDILTRRPKLIRPHYNTRSALEFPMHSSHLVGLKYGQCLELLLVFAVGSIDGGRGCCGVFVEVDLITQQCRELEWIRCKESDTPTASCELLALDRRRRQQQQKTDLPKPAAKVTKPQRREAKNEKHQSVHRSGDASADYDDEMLARMYPNCQTMDNQAVRRHAPILSLTARSAPVQVTYY